MSVFKNNSGLKVSLNSKSFNYTYKSIQWYFGEIISPSYFGLINKFVLRVFNNFLNYKLRRLFE